MNLEYLEQFETETLDLLLRDGITIRWGRDFNAFKLIMAQQSERHDIAPGFDPRHHRGRTLDGLWLAAFDRNGVLIHTQAARHQKFEKDFLHHLETDGESYEPSYWRFDSKQSTVELTPAAAAITGHAIYHGENWMLGGPDGYRGGHFIYLFCRLMLARILRTWHLETIYGFVTPDTGPKGLAQRVGYVRCEPCSVQFQQSGRDPVELWLVWMTREEAKFVLRLPPEYYLRRFGVEKPSKTNEFSLRSA